MTISITAAILFFTAAITLITLIVASTLVYTFFAVAQLFTTRIDKRTAADSLKAERTHYTCTVFKIFVTFAACFNILIILLLFCFLLLLNNRCKSHSFNWIYLRRRIRDDVIHLMHKTNFGSLLRCFWQIRDIFNHIRFSLFLNFWEQLKKMVNINNTLATVVVRSHFVLVFNSNTSNFR